MNEHVIYKDALIEAIGIADGQTALAEKMKPHLPKHLRQGFRQGHISNWLNRERKTPIPPVEYCPAISAAVDGKVPCVRLRPDFFVGLKTGEAA